MEAKELVMRFVKDESGLETVEYAIMTGLIVIAIILAVTNLGTKIASAFTYLTGKIKDTD